jgi:hypothetical protein
MPAIQADRRPVRGRVRRAVHAAGGRGRRTPAHRTTGDVLRRGAGQGRGRHDRPDGPGRAVPVPRRLRDGCGAARAAPAICPTGGPRSTRQPANHWHVDTYGVVAPLSRQRGLVRRHRIASCGVGDVPAATTTAGTTSSSSARPSARPRPFASRPTSCTTASRVMTSSPCSDVRLPTRPSSRSPVARASPGTASARQRLTTRSPTPRPNGTKAPTLLSPSSSIPTAPGRTATACGPRTAPPASTTSR